MLATLSHLSPMAQWLMGIYIGLAVLILAVYILAVYTVDAIQHVEDGIKTKKDVLLIVKNIVIILVAGPILCFIYGLLLSFLDRKSNKHL